MSKQKEISTNRPQIYGNQILTSEQIKDIISNPEQEALLYQHVRLSSRGNDSAVMVKSVRSDERNFWGSFLRSITEKQQLSKGLLLEDLRKPLRVSKKANIKYKVTSRGVVDVASYQYTKEKKEGKSKKQSATLLKFYEQNQDPSNKKNFTPPVFGWNTDRGNQLSGVIFFSNNINNDPKILISNVLQYDGGTYNRPSEYSSKYLAKLYYYNKRRNKKIFSDPEELFKYGIDYEYNEVLVRIQWIRNDPMCQLGIFTDNLESRLIAQVRAIDIKCNLETEFVPISFYLSKGIESDANKKLFEYRLQEQQQDLQKTLTSSNRQLKAMARLIMIYNQQIDLATINIADQIDILKLMTQDELTVVTKIALLKQVTGIDLNSFELDLCKLNLNIKDQEIILRAILISEARMRYSIGCKDSLNSDAFKSQVFMLAVADNNLPFVAKLLEYQGSLLYQVDHIAQTPLIRAAIYGHAQVAQLLINSAGDSLNLYINTPDKDGKTALMHAVIKGHIEVVKTLIKQGAKLDLEDKHKKTALMYANKCAHKDIVQELIKYSDLQQPYKKLLTYSIFPKKVNNFFIKKAQSNTK